MAQPYISIAVLGSRSLQKRFDRFEKNVQKKIVRQALRAAARPMLVAAKAKVPVDTGRLKKSLRLRALKQRRGIFGVQVRTGTRAELGMWIGDKTGYYPASVEWGHGSVPARPYLRPAFDETRDEALRILKAYLRRAIKEVRPA